MTHELAHEWWYALIGDDQARDPWLDEAFASYSERPRARSRSPSRPGERARGDPQHGVLHERRYRVRAHLRRGRACSTRCASGSVPRFAVALRRYAVANRYGWSTGAEFRAAMDAASRVPLDDLWRRYRVS